MSQMKKGKLALQPINPRIEIDWKIFKKITEDLSPMNQSIVKNIAKVQQRYPNHNKELSAAIETWISSILSQLYGNRSSMVLVNMLQFRVAVEPEKSQKNLSYIG